MRRAIRRVLLLLVASALVFSLFPYATHGPATSSIAGSPSLGESAVTPAVDPPANPYVTGMGATVAIGAPSLSAVWTTPNASAFGGAPHIGVLDSRGDLWVTDFSGNRVLEFLPPLQTGEAASLVLGQSNFDSVAPGTTATSLANPVGITFDSAGDLWVGDWGNDRVLEFVPPFHTGMAASLVLGQTTFTAALSACTQSGLNEPGELSFDSHGNLWVSDLENARVLEFQPPFSTGEPASLVIGEPSFTTCTGGTTASTIARPNSAFVSGHTLWVADEGNNRVLGYPAPYSTGEAATVVLGQSSFTTSSSTGENALSGPNEAYPDGNGNLWVADTYDNRVLEFLPPFSDFEAPSVVVGQSSLGGTAPGLSATNLTQPAGVFVAPNGALWVTDTDNSRVLEYLPTQFGVTITASGLPTGTEWSATIGPSDVSGTTTLTGSLINGSYAVNVVAPPGYSADPAYFTLTVSGSDQTFAIDFSAAAPNPFSAGMPATVVIGQPNFHSALVSTGPGLASASTIGSDDYAAAFDSHGDLWVADTLDARVLEFTPPFTDGMAASLVIGQSTLGGSSPGLSPTNLSIPQGIAFDASGDLWISDTGNNRVLEYVPPFFTGMAASLVLGQSTFYSQAGAASASGLGYPTGLGFDPHGDLWVTDYDNNRVVEYVPPFSNNESASSVLGQPNLLTAVPATSAAGERAPAWISFDSQGDAWVADSGNNRVVEYPAPLAPGEAATVVLGQKNLTTSSTIGPDSLSIPNGVLVVRGNVWVADSGHNRVVEYSGPSFSDLQTPTMVLGQGNLTTSTPALGPSGLAFPSLVMADPSGDIWVLDDGNDRVLGYIPASYSLSVSESGLPSGTAWSITVNGTTYATSASSLTVPEYNGSYAWSAPSVSGFLVSGVASGTTTVNGAGVSLALSFQAVTYAVTFAETGLPVGTNWSVQIDGSAYSSSAASLSVALPNGTYGYTLLGVPGFIPTATVGSLTIASAGASQSVTYIPFTYDITFTESGLPSGTPWSVTVNGVVFAGVSVSLLIPEPNGSFSFQVGSVPNYTATPGSGSGSISAAPASYAVTFASTPPSPSPAASPSSGTGTLFWAALAAAIVLAIAVVALAVRGRRGGGAGTAAPSAGASPPSVPKPAPPSTPEPPWSESGPSTPSRPPP